MANYPQGFYRKRASCAITTNGLTMRHLLIILCLSTVAHAEASVVYRR